MTLREKLQELQNQLEVLKEEKSSFRRQLITSLCQLDVEEIKVFEKFIDKFLAEREKAKKEEG